MSTEIYSLVESKIMTDDIQAFKAQAKKMKDATEDEIGTISYDFFIDAVVSMTAACSFM